MNDIPELVVLRYKKKDVNISILKSSQLFWVGIESSIIPKKLVSQDYQLVIETFDKQLFLVYFIDKRSRDLVYKTFSYLY